MLYIYIYQTLKGGRKDKAETNYENAFQIMM
jgi:hypothetical protein